MKYKSVIYLKKIIYSGDNIGRNFNLSFQLDNQSRVLNITLVNGQTRNLNKKLFETLLSRPHKANLSVSVQEKDKYPDEGEDYTTVTLASIKRQNAELSVSIPESDKDGETTIEGELKLFLYEETYELDEKKLLLVGNDGWIKGRYYDTKTGELYGEEESLPLGLLVKIKDVKIYNSEQNGYIGEEYFEVMEGWIPEKKKEEKNNPEGREKANLRLRIPKGLKSRFTSEKSYSSPCKVVFTIVGYDEDNNLKGKIDIYINNRKVIKNIIAISKPEGEDYIPPGVYPLEISDTSHKFGLPYLSNSKYSTHWFRITYKKKEGKEFYFHYGERTAGCITVSRILNPDYPHIWDKIFENIVWCRGKRGIVGELEVITKN